MNFFPLLGVFFLWLTEAAAGHHSNDPLLKFALEGETITLPCGIPSIKSCSSVNWVMQGEFRSIDEVVKAGRVIDPSRHVLLKDCSLQISNVVLNDARLYSCESGTLNANVSLQFLYISEKSSPAKDTLELHCYLNIFKGSVPCFNHKEIRIKWTTEDDTPLNESRFRIKEESNCFSKLIITTKETDHRRKWKCHLTQNGTVKVAITHMTAVRDGVEEVFTAVGESLSLTCGNTSSFGSGGHSEWTVCESLLTANNSPGKCQIKAFHEGKGSSLVFHKVNAQHAGDYQCLELTGQKKALSKVRLHTLDVTAEFGPGGEDLTLTCVLTCAKACEENFNLTWFGTDLRQKLLNVNNTLKNKVFLQVQSLQSYDDVVCSVLREGALVISKTWRSANSLQTLAWLGLPVGLLICLVAGGVCVYMKRKHNNNAAKDPSSISMTHVYASVGDVNNEEQQKQKQFKREAAAPTYGFYDLLQPVN
ncbi:uncharacterized protein KZ484_025700 [Pholidichthys leucotaenia]